MSILKEVFNHKFSLCSWILLLCLCLSISFVARYKQFNNVTGVQNLEASYHVLLTIHSIQQNPLTAHWLLPTVSLGQENDKDIPWGATVPTKSSTQGGASYIYTSFTPMGFIVPYFVFSIFNIEVTLKNLAIFNFLLGSLVSIILFFLLFKTLRYIGNEKYTAYMGAFSGSLISIFSKEVLQSQGLVYWSQSLYQVVLVLTFYFLFLYLRSYKTRFQQTNEYALLFFIFLGALTEWTGYILGIGLSVLFWFGFCQYKNKQLAIKVILSLSLAGLITLIHFGAVIGLEQTILAFFGRFFARNTTSGSMTDLLNGYALSYGAFILVILALTLSSFFSKSSEKLDLSNNILIFLFIATCIPLLENLIMLQHAGQFSFDRLKFIFPASIVIAVGVTLRDFKTKILFLVLLIFASQQGYSSYRKDLRNYKLWKEVDYQNQLLTKAIKSSVDIKCSVLHSNLGVRGYANLLLGRGIYEYTSAKDSINLLEKTNSCSSVYIEGAWQYTDLQKYQSAIVTKVDHSQTKLELLAIEKLMPESFISNKDWNYSVCKDMALFFVPNTIDLQNQLTEGKEIIFKNGEVRSITKVNVKQDRIAVYLEGAPLISSEVGLPTEFVIRGEI